MSDTGRQTKLSRTPVANLRQVKVFVPEDHTSKVGVKSKLSRSTSTQPKKHLAWYVALNPNPWEGKISSIPQVKWKCPPKFALNTSWHVAAGEGSQETEAQKRREITVSEVVYPHLSVVLPSPFSSPDMGGACSDNSQIPIIPIIPIEATAETEMPFDISEQVDICIKSQSPVPPNGPTASEDLPLSQCNPCPQDQHVNNLLPDIIRGLESGDLEVAVAAAATVAAVMESKEQIDTELLIKFLTDPEMVKKLTDEKVLAAKPEHGIPPTPVPVPDAKTSSPLPSSAPASVVASNECSEPLSRAIPSNSRLQAVNQSLTLPCSEAQKAINKSAASKQDGITAGRAPICTLKPAKKSSRLARSNSVVPPIKKLTVEPRELGHSHMHQIAGVKQVGPLLPSNLRPDEETIKRMVNQYGAPGIAAGFRPVVALNPSTSKPKMEAIKKMINEYGAHNAAGIKPMSPLIAFTSGPLNMETMKTTVNEYGVFDHGWGKPFLGRQPLLLASPPTPNLHVLPNALESNFTATGSFRFPSYSHPSGTTPLVDIHCHKSLNKHGKNHDTQEHKLPKGLELAHNTKIEMKPKYQKSCIYFSSLKGCRNGSNCQYQHDVSKQWRAGGALEAPVAKRMKFSAWTGK